MAKKQSGVNSTTISFSSGEPVHLSLWTTVQKSIVRRTTDRPHLSKQLVDNKTCSSTYALFSVGILLQLSIIRLPFSINLLLILLSSLLLTII